MLARVFSCAVIGLEGVIIEVEVDTGQGLPSIVVVGLPDAEGCYLDPAGPIPVTPSNYLTRLRIADIPPPTSN